MVFSIALGPIFIKVEQVDGPNGDFIHFLVLVQVLTFTIKSGFYQFLSPGAGTNS